MTNDNTEPMSVEGAIRCLETWESVLIAVKGTAGRIAALIRSMEERHEKGEKWADQIIDDQAEDIKELDIKIDELKAQLEEKDKVISELKALVNDIGPGGQYDPR